MLSLQLGLQLGPLFRLSPRVIHPPSKTGGDEPTTKIPGELSKTGEGRITDLLEKEKPIEIPFSRLFASIG